MPELPEVETVRLGLIQAVAKKRIVDVDIRQEQLRFPVPTARLHQDVVGRRIESIHRRAKYIIFQFSRGRSMLVHLGMSGKLFVTSPDAEMDKHDHVIFLLGSGEHLRFRDVRRFGMIDVCKTSELSHHPRLKDLGVEPLSDDFHLAYCLERAKNSQRPIKNMLMDANVIVGLGNIYANEALFAAKIHPQRDSGSLNEKEWRKLMEAIRSVLQEAIAQGGTTLQDEGFRNVLGTGGMFQFKLKVYGREGEKCPRCGRKIVRFVQQGRSSFVCRKCQRIKPRNHTEVHRKKGP
ncbi:MAG: bifunctional DNA-formamidopyrimidine glycosylase/DNA-(apurinic or apyrimidinic site) lyase [bacterium]